MDANAAEILGELNNRFYRKVASSFSQTRDYPWKGWDAVYGKLAVAGIGKQKLDVLDVACGNLRFEKFAHEKCPDVEIVFTAVDSCEDLVGERPNVAFECRDIVAELRRESSGNLFGSERYDAVVCFGFMHHVYGAESRRALVEHMHAAVKPGGIMAVSFWEFAQDDVALSKAEAVTRQGLTQLGLDRLEEGDYLLGWNNMPNVFRYCHSFTSKEIDGLLAGLQATCVERYLADGKNGRANEYVIVCR